MGSQHPVIFTVINITATQLKLSTRTVEFYLKQAKERCFCGNLEALQRMVNEQLLL
ncbi:hypothetical protein [Legionella clemsonensis]|uniref:hypothetical protein n=1 Tax=Legionella clemsonensis TaxID=1867846 RepID=UPI0012FD9309|nr:hypothetical protein [Legionella clemsonensis]